MPRTCVSADLHGSIRYSARIGEDRTYVRIEARLESRDGRARRRHSPRHAAAADAAGARPRVPPARRGRLDARRHRASGCPTRRSVGGGARAGRRSRRDDLRHALPSGPRRRGRRSPRADRRAGRPGRARLRAVRARLGEPRLVGAARRLVPAPRRARRRHRGARRARAPCTGRSSATSATRSSSRPASTSTAGSSSPRPATPTGSSASCATACWSPRITCSGGSRRRSGSGRRAAPDPLGDYLAALDRTIELAPTDRAARPRRPDRGSRPAARDELQEHHRVRLGGGRGRARGRAADGLRALVRALRRRAAAGRAPLRDRRDALASRAARATRARLAGTRSTGPLPILPPDHRGRRLPAEYRRP